MRIPHENDDDDTALLLPDEPPTPPRTPLPFYQTRSTTAITIILMAVVVVLSFGAYLTAVPSIRIYEDIVCHHYYDQIQGEGHIGLEEQIDESLCKIPEVQQELNILLAGLHVIGAIPCRF